MSTKFDYFSEHGLRRGLKAKTVRGGLYTGLAQGAMALVALVTVPVMARLLQPADFGMLAMVAVFTGFAAMFVDAGFSMATIQQAHINHQQVSNLFWITAALGVAVALLTCAASPLIAWFYGEPRLMPITCAISVSFVLSGLTVQHQALLRRSMRYNAITFVQVGSYIGGYIVAITLAWIYRSYWALVALPLSAALFRMLGTWFISAWRPSLPRREPGMWRLIHFGAHLTGFTFVNYFARNADNMLIGWWWGQVPLGFYERSYKLMMTPLAQINAPLMNVIVPALSRLRDEPAKYREAYFRAVGMLQIVSCPLMAFVVVTAPWVVDVVFGPRWQEVAPILRWLAIAGFLQPLSNSLGWLYISQGRTVAMLKWGLIGGALIVASFILGLGWGPVGVARAYALMICLIIVPLSYFYVGRTGPVTAWDLFQLTGYALLYSAPAALLSCFVAYCLPGLSSFVKVLVSGFASTSASALFLFSTQAGRRFATETLLILKQAVIPVHKSNGVDQLAATNGDVRTSGMP
jgi:PST family polysaccharide transporter